MSSAAATPNKSKEAWFFEAVRRLSGMTGNAWENVEEEDPQAFKEHIGNIANAATVLNKILAEYAKRQARA